MRGGNMPELPEVEAWRRGLEAWWGHRVIDEVRVVDSAVVRPVLSTRPSEAMSGGEAWLLGWVGAEVGGLDRIGKRIGVHIGARWVLIHLGMTGRFTLGDEPPRAARFGVRARGGPMVWFSDTRRFGCVAPLADRGALAEGLGPDALGRWGAAELRARLAGRRPIKVALLDQAAIAGLGNIHAAEALYRARIAPNRPCAAIDDAGWSRLATAIQVQLTSAIAGIPADVSTFEYVNEGGENPFQVYAREGEPCARCGHSIARDVHAGRSTFWCPGCQVD